MVGRKHLVAAVLGVSLLAAAAPGTATATKPSYGCAPGFNLGAVTFEQYLDLPRTQAAIDAGLIDDAGIIAGLSHYDANEDEVICVQLNLGYQISNRPFGQYLYNVVDNASSAP
jgi:hypothetical protein